MCGVTLTLLACRYVCVGHLDVVGHAQRAGGALEEAQHERGVCHSQLVAGARHALKHVRQEQPESSTALTHSVSRLRLVYTSTEIDVKNYT